MAFSGCARNKLLEADTVEARTFVVRDESGRTRAELGIIYDALPLGHVSAHQAPTVNPGQVGRVIGLELYDEDGAPRLVAVVEGGIPRVLILDKGPIASLVAGYNAAGDPAIALYRRDGKLLFYAPLDAIAPARS